MDQYNVTGMSCAACQARVEKAVGAVDGVTECAVSLLTNSMGVSGTAKPEAIIKAVEAAGYGASLKSDSNKKSTSNYDSELEDHETPAILKRLIASIVLLIPLMYVSMGHMMWNWPLPGFMKGNHIAMGIYELILAGLVMVINQKFFVNGFKGLIHLSPNMDTLVALGSMVSWLYSVVALFVMTTVPTEKMAGYMDEFYFESAAMILTLITVGKLLEARSKGKTTDALKALMKLSPKTAILLYEGQEKEVDVSEVKVGDRFVVKPGAEIPVDGIVVEGFSAVNESTFTGESIPVDKAVGDSVSTATINTNGHMICEATRVGEDTSLSKVIKMVSDAAATKAPIAKIADKVSGVFVPVVISISLVTLVVWLLFGQEIGYALARAISVLVISCPCALGLATPVAIMVGNGVGARNGILFKNAVTLEQTGKVKIVALDKTGTITTGRMQVSEIIPVTSFDRNDLLRLTASLEAKSEHPISQAITDYAAKENIMLTETTDFLAVAGNGLKGKVGDVFVYAGNEAYIKKATGHNVYELSKHATEAAQNGKTPVFVASDDKLLGLITVGDTVKDDSKQAISELKKLGIHVVMLTGDNKITANAIAMEVGVNEVVAGVKPDGKAHVIEALMQEGMVAMVGDGINDAPALTRADVGIAIGAGTDIAIDAADIVLSKNSLRDVAASIRISRATIINIHENLFWAFFYNIIGIPLAAGCYVALFGWTLNPMFGAAAMSLSSFCVVTNALRLNWVKLYDPRNDKIMKNALNKDAIYYQEEMEDRSMKITVTGMMCPRCEAHVKQALEKIEGVAEAVANHSENLVTLTLAGEVSEQAIKAAIEEAGYEFGGIL